MARVAAAVRRSAGQGGLSVQPVRRTVLIAGVVGAWVVMQLALVAWWATVIGRQARRIAELEAAGGADHALAGENWSRTRLMLVGESSSFLALLLAVSLLLAWLYWREHRRARSMQAFFASVTHELRTPLTSIRLQAEAIAEGQGGPELARRLLEDSHRLESQIDNTLELARIEGGGPLSEQAIPLNTWLIRALEDLSLTYGERVEVRTQLADSLPAVQADARALQMVLRNLVDNSVRHSGVQPVHVQLTAAQRGAHVIIDYRDDGRGVARGARLGRLFGRGMDSSGAGVGLYLVRRLMQRMGGAVRYNTGPGEGFRCELILRPGA